MTALIRKLPANTEGKDYVVGDLHGCYHLLERLLVEVQFDKARDRLFSVGDLVDRGPDSLRCLELLAEPWFFAVMGNHEEMMLTFFLSYLETGTLESLQDANNIGYILNGGEWVEQYYLPEQKRMAEEFNRGLLKIFGMPLVLVIGEGDSRFHIVHAEIANTDHNLDEQTVFLDSDIDQWLVSESLPKQMYEGLLWGRLLFYTGRINKFMFENKKQGLSTTFCGHTPTTSPCQVLSHLCVDTGAYFTLGPDSKDEGYGLTLFDVQGSCWLTASYLRDEIIKGDFVIKRT